MGGTLAHNFLFLRRERLFDRLLNTKICITASTWKFDALHFNRSHKMTLHHNVICTSLKCTDTKLHYSGVLRFLWVKAAEFSQENWYQARQCANFLIKIQQWGKSAKCYLDIYNNERKNTPSPLPTHSKYFWLNSDWEENISQMFRFILWGFQPQNATAWV